MKYGKRNRDYSERLRSFALTLNYYSPRAYEYLRNTCNNHLPSVSTLRSWYSSIDGSPGLCSEILQELKNRASQANRNGQTIIGTLIFDEMNIRQLVQYDEATKTDIGYVNFGTHEIVDEKNKQKSPPVASKALVYMFIGTNMNIQIPVAYFLIHGLSHVEKAAITGEVILALTKTGVKIAALTFDGAKENKPMCESLGANFELDMPFIVNPHSDDRIYIIHDPPHMEKLARNTLARNEVLYDRMNRKIEWKYFVALEEFQRSNLIKIGNNVNKSHVQWFRKMMSVRTAVETLSDSVANAMDFLRLEGVEEFQGCEATVQYIRYMNNIFDMLNSRFNSSKKTKFKRPLCADTKEEFFAYIDEAIDYINHLNLNPNKKILESRSQTAFFGFIQNLKNLKSMYHEYIESGVVDEIYTFFLNQDPVELFFCRIRSRGGFNDNPTVQQFIAAFRRLSIRNDIKASRYGNCIAIETVDNILFVPSRRPKLSTEENEIEILTEENNNNNDEIEAKVIESISKITDNVDVNIQYHVVAYMASIVEKSIITSSSPRYHINCSSCLQVFYENDLQENRFLELQTETSDVNFPCKSTVEICLLTENILHDFEYRCEDYNQLAFKICSNINHDNMFLQSDFDNHSDDNHKSILILRIIQVYIKKKMNMINRFRTQNQVDKILRSQVRKHLHFTGQ